MNLVTKLKHSFFGAGSRYVLQLISMIVMARLITPEQFGIYSTAVIILNFSFMIFQVGGSAIVSSSKKVVLDEAFDISTQICFILSIVLISLMFFFSDNVKSLLKIEDESIFYALAVIMIFRAITGPLEGKYAANSDFKKVAMAEFYSYLIGYFFVTIILGYIFRSYWALVFGSMSQAIILYSCLSFKTSYKPNFHPYIKYKEYFILGGGYLSSKIFNYISTQGDNFLVNYYMGKESLGLYSKAYQLMVVPTNFLGQVVNRVLVPHFQSNKPSMIFSTYLWLNIISSLSLFFLFVGFSKDIIIIVLGESWVGISPVIIILSACVYSRVDYKFSESVIISSRNVKMLTILNAGYAFFLLLFCFLFLNDGLEGIASAVFYTTTIYSVLMLYFSKVLKSSTFMMKMAYFSTHIFYLFSVTRMTL